jgi:hypothetical protein
MSRTWVTRVCLSALCLSPYLAQAETVTCSTFEGVEDAYQLEIDWTSETATILRREASGVTKLFAKATVVRNNASDPSFLAEGTPKQFVGNFGGKCGRMIPQLYFDIGVVDGERVGTMERKFVWAVKPGTRVKDCQPPFATPDVVAETLDVTCQ